MHLNTSTQDLEFRHEIRVFIRDHLPKDLREKVENGIRIHAKDTQRWHKILAAHGWGAPSWPVSEGGCGWDGAKLYIFEEELALGSCPP
ncbi:MAG TPA: pimeloyl-CoA dehydrogenase large subunit, partial [Alphaproteobacteria bacterium]|nr:pimeloyl-CoA dehydrogenase large subunit [Alphaproteobacteria bacterium]